MSAFRDKMGSVRSRWLVPVVLALLGIGAVLRADVPVVHTLGLNFDRLLLRDGIFYWKNPCGSGGEPGGSIGRVPLGGGQAGIMHRPAACAPRGVRSQNIAVDAAGAVYWMQNDGQIVMAPSSADGTVTPVFRAQLVAANAVEVHVAVTSSWLYWTEGVQVNDVTRSGAVYRVPLGGGARQTVCSLSAATGEEAVALLATDVPDRVLGPRDILYYRRRGGALERVAWEELLSGGAGWVRSTLTGNCTAMALTGGRFHFADVVSSSVTNIRSAPIAGGTAVVEATASTSGGGVVTDLARSGSVIFWRELRSGQSDILRQTAGSGIPSILATGSQGAALEHVDLVAEGRRLLWGTGQWIIYLPLDATSGYNVAAQELEAVQAVQTPAHDVPLTAGRTTWVRTAATSTPAGMGYPLVRLRGMRGGAPLPGSPLDVVAGPPGLSTLPQRRSSGGHWFRLPEEWTHGTITVRAEYNPALVLPVLSTNSTLPRTLTFLDVPGLRLESHPLRTGQGTLQASAPGMAAALDRAESLLPSSAVVAVWPGTAALDEPEGAAAGAYELSLTDDDTSEVLVRLLHRRLASAWADPAFRSHTAALFPLTESSASPDLALPGLPVSLSGYTAEPAWGPDRPLGGTLLARAAAQGLGRLGAGCPTDNDPAFPYTGGSFSDSAATVLGWDAVRAWPVLPGTAGDLMSCLPQRWISDYTWRGLQTTLRTTPSPPPPGVGGRTLVTGLTLPGGGAVIHAARRLAGGAAETAAQQLVNNAADRTTWLLRIETGTGALLGTAVVGVIGPVGGERRMLVAVVEENASAGVLRLVRSASPFTTVSSVSGGGTPPAVAVTAPVPGSVTGTNLSISWTASDTPGQTLRHLVRYSHDQGQSWIVLTDDTVANSLTLPAAALPGGTPNRSIVQILSTDGLRTSLATSDFFTVPPRAPAPRIAFETAEGRECPQTAPAFPAGTTVILRGRADDPEDTLVGSTGLSWNITSAGGTPSSWTGTGPEAILTDFAPGSYQIVLTATDSHGVSAQAQAAFTIRPISVPSTVVAPLMDSFLDDAAWAADTCRVFRLPRPGNDPAYVRMLESGGFLHVAITGLPTGAIVPGAWIALSFDPDYSRHARPQPGDLRLAVHTDGETASARGNGTTWVADPVRAPFTARVYSAFSTWAVEFRIPVSLLGGWNGQTIGMDAGHYWLQFTGDDAHWFGIAGDAWQNPSLWLPVKCAADPSDPRDADLDGMADAWESAILPGGALATADADGDGFSNGAEFAAGTDPMSAASRPSLRAVPAAGGQTTLTWQANAGQLYTVESSADLREFIPAGPGIPGTGAEVSITLPRTAGISRRYYRLRIQPCPP